MLAGPLAYETIQNNIPLALPSLSSTNRYISKKHSKLVEGQLRITELSQYLKQRNLPRIVSLSEDATRINGTIQFDSISNEILGFVPPLNKFGMPKPHSYPARSFEEIYEYFCCELPHAHNVNVVMAQPMGDVPAFCILLFSSDAKYTSEEVAKRWNFISVELKKADIFVIVASSDSEPKYNSAMRKCSGLGLKSNIFGNVDWFNMFSYEEESAGIHMHFIQDTVHIATKLRNLLLKTLKNPKQLPFGPNLHIQLKHLVTIMENFTKDQHRLTASVLNPIDRQNFKSVLRIIDDMVIRLLTLNVSKSEGTVKFLQMTRDIIDAFSDVYLTPLQKIQKIWGAVFVLRIWKQYVVSNKNLNVGEHFLTSYCYSCIEINAHNLVLIMLNLKKNGYTKLFLPHLYGSQACESMFRQIRSLTSVFNTVTNCSVRDLINRMNRIELQGEIAFTSDFVYPRIKKLSESSSENLFELPTKEQIIEQIEQCREDAIQFALKIGLLKRNQISLFSFGCKIPPLSLKSNTWKKMDESATENFISRENLICPETLALKNFADKFIDKIVPVESPYVEIPFSRNRKVIKKSSMVWLLRAESVKLSNDRLLRVRTKFSKRIKSKKVKNNFSCIPTMNNRFLRQKRNTNK